MSSWQNNVFKCSWFLYHLHGTSAKQTTKFYYTPHTVPQIPGTGTQCGLCSRMCSRFEASLLTMALNYYLRRTNSWSLSLFPPFWCLMWDYIQLWTCIDFSNALFIFWCWSHHISSLYSQTLHFQSEADALAQGGLWDPEGDWSRSIWRGTCTARVMSYSHLHRKAYRIIFIKQCLRGCY